MGLSAGCAELDQLSQEQLGSGIGALAGGVAGALVGTQFGSTTGQLVATLVGTVAGAWVGNRIGAYLDEQDRQRAAEATQQATVTGQPQVWQNPDSGVSGRAEVVKTKTTQQNVAVPVLKDRVQQVPPLELIGEPYRATTSGNVRGGPGADYTTVGRLNKGETVTVAGKVKGQPWYMISQGGAGSGFVSASLLTRAPSAVAAKEPEAPSGAVEKRTVEAERTCRTVKQTVTLADKSTREEEVTACQGPNGWQVS
jgi:surface antigen